MGLLNLACQPHTENTGGREQDEFVTRKNVAYPRVVGGECDTLDDFTETFVGALGIIHFNSGHHLYDFFDKGNTRHRWPMWRRHNGTGHITLLGRERFSFAICTTAP